MRAEPAGKAASEEDEEAHLHTTGRRERYSASRAHLPSAGSPGERQVHPAAGPGRQTQTLLLTQGKGNADNL